MGPWLRGRAEGGRSAGLDPSVIPWLRARDVAVMGSDHPQYVSPGPAGLPPGAIHDFALIYLGLPLFDNCDLEALAEAAAARNRWSFLLSAAPSAGPRRHRIAAQPGRHLLNPLLLRGSAFASCRSHREVAQR